MAGMTANAGMPGQQPVFGGGGGAPPPGGGPDFGIGGGQLGSIFAALLNRPAGAPIAPATVATPNRADFGTPMTAPTIANPIAPGAPGGPATPDRQGIDAASYNALQAAQGFNDPTHTAAFTNLMGLANEVTGAQESEQSRQAADAAQRRGYAGGFEDTARQAAADRQQALATAGFQGAQMVQQEEGAQYGRAVGAFAQLQDSYNQALTTQNVAYAHDLTTTHIAQAEDALKTMELNSNQQLAYAGAVTSAKELQAKLLQDYNGSLIDNAKFIQGNASIAASLFGALASLQEKGREFDISQAEGQREFNLTGAERQSEFDVTNQESMQRFEQERQDAITNRNVGLETQGRGPTGRPNSGSPYANSPFSQLAPF